MQIYFSVLHSDAALEIDCFTWKCCGCVQVFKGNQSNAIFCKRRYADSLEELKDNLEEELKDFIFDKFEAAFSAGLLKKSELEDFYSKYLMEAFRDEGLRI